MITTVSATGGEASWASLLDEAANKGLKVIVGATPDKQDPVYKLDRSTGRWDISKAVPLLQYLSTRSDVVMALNLFDEPFWTDPMTLVHEPYCDCGCVSADELRNLVKQIKEIWPDARIFSDMSGIRDWAHGSGGWADVVDSGWLDCDQSDENCHFSNCRIGNKYDDMTGIFDMIDIYWYPFVQGDNQSKDALASMLADLKYVHDKMPGTMVGANIQTYRCDVDRCEGLASRMPTYEELLTWQCTLRGAADDNGVGFDALNMYVWTMESGLYRDYLSKHSELWDATRPDACN